STVQRANFRDRHRPWWRRVRRPLLWRACKREESQMATRTATSRMTMAQAVVKFLSQQYVARDGVEQPFFAGVWGIFGHGNVAGLGQALEELKLEVAFHRPQNEQGMVHAAIAYAKMKNRLQAFACTSSIGP